MASGLIRVEEAVEQIHRFILALASGGEIPSPTQPYPPPSSVATAARQPEIVPLEQSLGRVLALPICADRDLPPFPRSTRDGYACRASDANTHQFLFLAGQVRAGQQPVQALRQGEIWEIMTGAPVPEGADCVLMQEHVELESNFVRQLPPRVLAVGENIVPRGAEARAGEALIPAGVRIGAAHVALAAQCGMREVAVFPWPRVAILSSGDELVSYEQSPGPGQIRNSNSPMLAAMVAAAGALPFLLPVAADRMGELDAALAVALDASGRYDLLLITGGISVGRFDLVADGLGRHGARIFFRGVAMQPGKPVTFGQLPRGGGLPQLPVLALPGNPVSTAVTFQLFALPLLTALADETTPQPRYAQATLVTPWQGKPGLQRYLPGWCDFGPRPCVEIVPWQGSGDIRAFAASNCFVVVDEQTGELAQGSTVTLLLR